MNYILRREGYGDNAVAGIIGYMEEPCESVLNKPAVPDNLKGFVFRWGTTSTIPNYRANGAKIVNTAEAIHAGYDKRNARLAFQKAGILTPESWPTIDEAPKPTPDKPLIVRPFTHQKGEDMIVVTNLRQIIQAEDRLGKELYVQRLIKKEREFRVHVAQGRVMQVSEKFPDDKNQLAWGVDRVEFANVRWSQWPIAMVREALAAANLLGYDFAAVDIILDKDGMPFVLECNSAPEIWDYTQQCYARAFDYIIRNGKKRLEVTGDTWKHYIHPSNTEAAVV